MRRFAAIFALGLVLLVGPLVARAELARELTWDNLVPEGPPIENPFMDLTVDQQVELEMLASIRAQQSRGLVSEVNPLYEDGLELAHKLRTDGLQVERLLEEYEVLRQKIEVLNAQTVDELDGQLIRMPGYVLPLEFDGTSVEEFLLVPYVGACIHVPPPPKNQMVFVRLERSYAARELFEPVWITGRLKVESTTKSLYLVDGTADVHAGYTMEGIRVEPYTE